MPSTVVEVDTYTATVSVPNDGEFGSSASINGAIQALANRAQYNRSRVLGGSPNYRITIPLAAELATLWAFSGAVGPGGNAYGWSQTSVGGVGLLVFPLWVPATAMGHTITALRAQFRPVTAGRAAVPATQPAITLLRQPSDASIVVTVGTAQLAAGSVGAYEAPQLLLLTVAHTVSLSDSYYVVFQGETDPGANDVVGLALTRIELELQP